MKTSKLTIIIAGGNATGKDTLAKNIQIECSRLPFTIQRISAPAKHNLSMALRVHPSMMEDHAFKDSVINWGGEYTTVRDVLAGMTSSKNPRDRVSHISGDYVIVADARRSDEIMEIVKKSDEHFLIVISDPHEFLSIVPKNVAYIPRSFSSTKVAAFVTGVIEAVFIEKNLKEIHTP